MKQNKHFKGSTIANFDPVIPIEEKVGVKNLGKDGMEVLLASITFISWLWIPKVYRKFFLTLLELL
jgi:hypothetical protein